MRTSSRSKVVKVSDRPPGSGALSGAGSAQKLCQARPSRSTTSAMSANGWLARDSAGSPGTLLAAPSVAHNKLDRAARSAR